MDAAKNAAASAGASIREASPRLPSLTSARTDLFALLSSLYPLHLRLIIVYRSDCRTGPSDLNSDQTELSARSVSRSEVLSTRRVLSVAVSVISTFHPAVRDTETKTDSYYGFIGNAEFTTDGAIGGTAQIAGENISGGTSPSISSPVSTFPPSFPVFPDPDD